MTLLSRTLLTPLALCLAAGAQAQVHHHAHPGHAAAPHQGSGHTGHLDGGPSASPAGHGAHEAAGRAESPHDAHAGHTRSGPVPPLSDADRAAAFPVLPPHAMHQGGRFYRVTLDRLEWQDGDHDALAWDFDAWYGGDIDRLVVRSEGERRTGRTEEAELQLLWSHALGPWWEGVLGVRQDFQPGAPQTWATLGVQGTPLYGLETQASVFLGEGGQSALRLEAEYDLLLTQRWVLQPALEANLYGRDDPQRGVGSGLGDLSAGLRLRYEITRQWAPYLGVQWQRAYGDSADLRRAEGESASDTQLVLGLRVWF